MTRYDAPTLLNRARDLGIEVTTDGHVLRLKAHVGAVSEKARAVLAAHKQMLIAYLLASQQQAERAARSDVSLSVGDSSAASLPVSSLSCATCCVSILSPGIDFRFTSAGVLYCLEHYAAWEREQQERASLLPEAAPREKRIEVIDGVRVFVGYSDAEFKAMLCQEYITTEAQRRAEQAMRPRHRATSQDTENKRFR